MLEKEQLKETSYVSTAKKLLKEQKNIHILTWKDFEKLIVELLSSKGWSVYHTSKSKDGGIDIIATKNLERIGFFKIVCQIKRNNHSNPVGINIVRELGYLVFKTGASKGLIVTMSRLTRGAIKLVKENEYTLSYLDSEALENWILDDDKINDRNSVLDDLPF